MSNNGNKSTINEIMSQRPLRVLVAGATGYLGGLVVEACHREGWWVRALARDPAKLGNIKEMCDDIFVGHATKDDTLNGLCDGIDVVFSSIGFMSFAKKPSIWEVDYEANMNIVRRARAANVKHFVYTSTVGCTEMAKNVRIAQAKMAICKELEKSKFTWSVLEPTGFFDDMRKLFDHVRSRGTAIVFGSGNTKLNPIHGIDLANAAVKAIKDSSWHNKYIPVGGPEVYTHNEVAKLVFEVLGKPPKIRKVPPWLLKIISSVARPFNANIADMIWFFIAIGSIPDLSAPAFGNHHLKDFFQELAKQS